jgi:acyl dehydratase
LGLNPNHNNPFDDTGNEKMDSTGLPGGRSFLWDRNSEKLKKRYFEDLTDGELLHCQPVLMTRGAIIDFASKFDPQLFHIDENAARDSLFGGLIASSLHTLSACTRVVVEAQGNIAILSGVGMHKVKMFNPVRPDDVLVVNAWWTELQRSRSNPDRGFASIKCRVINQKKEPVVEYGYRYLIACKNYQAPPPG